MNMRWHLNNGPLNEFFGFLKTKNTREGIVNSQARDHDIFFIKKKKQIPDEDELLNDALQWRW